MRVQHDVEDSELGFLVKEESALCLGYSRLRAAHTFSNVHPERLSLELVGPLFYPRRDALRRHTGFK